jgi:hypothetical protein
VGKAAVIIQRFLYLLIYDTREHLENWKIKISAPVMTINLIGEFRGGGARDFSSTERLKKTPAGTDPGFGSAFDHQDGSAR